MSDLQATFTVNTGPGSSVEMTGKIETLEKITMQMRTHADLLEACKKALEDYQQINHPTKAHQLVMARLRAAIGSVNY